jgi:hypothetical protein
MSIQEICVPDLPDLICKVEALATDYQNLLARFPESGRIRRILAKTQYPPPDGNTEQDLAAAFEWVNRLRDYILLLYQYFADRLERQDMFLGFPLVEWGLLKGFSACETFDDRACLRSLVFHKQKLLIEQKKQQEAWHGAFRQLLHEAMSAAPGHGIKGAADEMDIDRGTLGDYLNGRTDDLRTETKIKMRNYIVKYCPHAKPQIQQLGL